MEACFGLVTWAKLVRSAVQTKSQRGASPVRSLGCRVRVLGRGNKFKGPKFEKIKLGLFGELKD